jgi:hypothetical protein
VNEIFLAYDFIYRSFSCTIPFIYFKQLTVITYYLSRIDHFKFLENSKKSSCHLNCCIENCTSCSFFLACKWSHFLHPRVSSNWNIMKRFILQLNAIRGRICQYPLEHKGHWSISVDDLISYIHVYPFVRTRPHTYTQDISNERCRSQYSFNPTWMIKINISLLMVLSNTFLYIYMYPCT